MKQKWITLLAILVLVFILIPIILNMFNIKLTENMTSNYDMSGNNYNSLMNNMSGNNYDVSGNNYDNSGNNYDNSKYNF